MDPSHALLAPAEDFLTAGAYIGYRLLEMGCTHVFCVPGDFSLPLLDGLASVPGMTLVACASELNAAYAADGWARATGGIGVVVTTFLVGALSAINGVAASYAEEIPILSIVGVPSRQQYAGMCTLHHTLGNAETMSQEVQVYAPVTCWQTILRNFADARYLIDKALTRALTHRKPVLLEVCRDVALSPHASFGKRPPAMTPFALPAFASDAAALAAAGKAAKRFFSDKKRPLIVAGRRTRLCKAELAAFASAVGWGVIVLHDAKGMFDEDHPCFIGTHFLSFTSPTSVHTALEAADAIFFVGSHFNELNFGGVPDEALERKSVMAYKGRVLVAHVDAFTGVAMPDFLRHLTDRMGSGGAAAPAPGAGGILSFFRSLPATAPSFPANPAFTAPKGAPLTLDYFYSRVQEQLLDGSSKMAVVVDTGDSMLRTHCWRLPGGTQYHLQLLAGNIGWGLPAGLGFSLAAAAEGTRLLVLHGDGGLQMTASEIANYAKYGSNAIVVCVNNNGYLIERYLSPIPDSAYNYTPQWNYAAVAEGMLNGRGKYRVIKVATEAEADAAVAAVKGPELRDAFVFIEVVVDKRDAAPGAALMRESFMKQHFSNIAGYRKLNLPGSALALSSGPTGAAALEGEVLSEPRAANGRGMHAAGSSSCLAAATAAGAGAPARRPPAAAANGDSATAPGGSDRTAAAAPEDSSAGGAGGSQATPPGLLPSKRRAEGPPDASA